MFKVLLIALVLPLAAHAAEKAASDRAISARGSRAVGRKTIPDLEKELADGKTPAAKFHARSSIVRLYAVKSFADAKPDVELAKASEQAKALLAEADAFKNHWNYGNAIHHAHLVLGRVALAHGDLAAAKKELLAAATVSGSPQLDSFGPNMTLAKELADKKEAKAVLEYLDLVEKFWKSDIAKSKLKDWRATLKAGHTPDFADNLFY